MDLAKQYHKQLELLKRIINSRKKGTWIVVYVSDYQSENRVKCFLSEELTSINYRVKEIDLSRKPKDLKISSYLGQFIGSPASEDEFIKEIVFLTGLNKILLSDNAQSFLNQLNFERDRLFSSFNVIFFLFVYKADKNKLSFGAPDFWDWLQYFLSFDAVNTSQPADIYNLIFGSGFESVDQARQQIKKLLITRKKIKERNEAIDNFSIYALLNVDLQLIDAYLFLQDLDKAFSLIQEDLKLAEELRDDYNIAVLYEKLAEVFLLRGLLDEALKLMLQAARIFEDKFGREHSKLAGLYIKLAAVLIEQGQFDKALEYLFSSKDILEKFLGEGHPELAVSYNLIALVYLQKRDLSSALEYARKAVNIAEKVFGEDSLTLGESYAVIALIYYDFGDMSKAKEYLNKSVEILEQKLGPDHKRVKTLKHFQEFLNKEQKPD